MSIRYLSVISILLLCTSSCHFKIPPKLSADENNLLGHLSNEYRASGTRIEGLPNTPNGLNIVIVNSKIVKPENPNLGIICGMVVDSLLAADNYVNKYKGVQVTFEDSPLSNGMKSGRSKSYYFDESALNARLGRLTRPAAILIRKMDWCYDQKDYKKVILLADSLASMEPESAEFSEQYLGLAWINLKDTNQALQHYRKARNLKPYTSLNFANLARVYGYQNKYKLAIATIDTGIVFRPFSGKLYYLRGVFEHQLGNDNQACSDARKADSLSCSGASALVRQYCK